MMAGKGQATVAVSSLHKKSISAFKGLKKLIH